MSNTKPTILVASGGTGGHIFPALAVADKLSDNYQIIWLGTKQGMEQKLVKNYHIYNVSAVGIRGKSIKQLILAPFKLIKALFQTLRIIKKNKVFVIIGFGGFVGGIGGLAAILSNKKLIIHEQNSIAGTSNKYLNKFNIKSFCAFDNVLPNATTCGNPIRWQALPKDNLNNPHDKLNILVIGGSLGARAINEVMPQIQTNCIIYHQSGVKNFTEVKELYKKYNKQAEVMPFIDDMAKYYALADVVICRAGAMTISELIHTSSVAILVPFPFAIDNHQYHNAKILENKDCGVVLEQKNLNSTKIDEILDKLKDKIQEKQNNFAKFSKINSAQIIKKYIDSLMT
jgi:UDP-N-acetylglucosamine--N-acetylmuramyl-(pentapeptide) pyrophosphoryl-undecaprenol N-acetylglucosamine transferase